METEIKIIEIGSKVFCHFLCNRIIEKLQVEECHDFMRDDAILYAVKKVEEEVKWRILHLKQRTKVAVWSGRLKVKMEKMKGLKVYIVERNDRTY